MTSVERSEVRQALRALEGDGRTHVKARHVAAELDSGADSHKSIGSRLSQLSEKGVVERWSATDCSNGATWKILDPDAGLEAVTDGGQRTRECHACGATTTTGRCDECNARPWTDVPLPPGADPMTVACDLRALADRVEQQAERRETAEHEIRTDGGVEQGRWSDGATNKMREDTEPIDPATRAYIHLLRSLGKTQRYIARTLQIDTKTVRRQLDSTSERVDDGEDPVDVYADVMGPIHGLDPEAGGEP